MPFTKIGTLWKRRAFHSGSEGRRHWQGKAHSAKPRTHTHTHTHSILFQDIRGKFVNTLLKLSFQEVNKEEKKTKKLEENNDIITEINEIECGHTIEKPNGFKNKFFEINKEIENP